ncbi:hypothetical protein CIL05_07780 [Virgibacillus profundi]|uniref:Uncharacterized protein n=1 Tax=Virgibacillus profundi TaxID=2024555 RepID=A0A2A2IFN7_9BACI|nr:hypothetical protein [Virgibacillus profundi]PAV30362.1 hypothetical protein CIL05_07780 [Virgibacillus profundi]PXY54534.1 hypothetical protein CIT14_07865 [Virgibacillus profundi]
MIFRNELGQILGNGAEFFHNEDSSYTNIKCPNVIFSENDRNYLGVQLDYSFDDGFTLDELLAL